MVYEGLNRGKTSVVREAKDEAHEEDFFALFVPLAVDCEEFAHVFGAVEGGLVFVGGTEGSWPEDSDDIWEAVVSIWLEESKENDLETDLGG